ncbi:TPA: alpha-xenorhabdolysin family binary toxin subunit B [Pseudomonas putida]
MDIVNPVAVQYPDVTTMRSMQGEISKFLNKGARHLSLSLRENISDLLNLIREGEAQMKDQVLVAHLKLGHQNWMEVKAVANGLANAQEKDLQKDVEEELIRLRGQLQVSLQALSQQVTRVQVYRLGDLEERRTQLIETGGRQQANVDSLLEVIAGMEARKSELDEIITFFKVPTLFSIIKGLIPREEEVDLLLNSIKNPSVTPALAKAAIQKFEANVDVIGEGRKFADLVASRDKLVAQIAEQRGVLSALQGLLKQCLQEQEELLAAGNVDSCRNHWAFEAQKLITSWHTHQSVAQKATELGTLADALMALSGYLTNARHQFETA